MSFEFDKVNDEFYESNDPILGSVNIELTEMFRNLLDKLNYAREITTMFHSQSSHPKRNNFCIRNASDGYEIVYTRVFQSKLKPGQSIDPTEILQIVDENAIQIFVTEDNYEDYCNFVRFCNDLCTHCHTLNVSIKLERDDATNYPIQIPHIFDYVKISNYRILPNLVLFAEKPLNSVLFNPCSMSAASDYNEDFINMDVDFSNMSVEVVNIFNCPYKDGFVLRKLPGNKCNLNIKNLQANSISTQSECSTSVFRINCV